jgi:hypothetical protein
MLLDGEPLIAYVGIPKIAGDSKVPSFLKNVLVFTPKEGPAFTALPAPSDITTLSDDPILPLLFGILLILTSFTKLFLI